MLAMNSIWTMGMTQATFMLFYGFPQCKHDNQTLNKKLCWRSCERSEVFEIHYKLFIYIKSKRISIYHGFLGLSD